MHPRLTSALVPTVAVAALLAAPSAEAHDTLTGTYPATGSTLATPPAAVTLTFAEPVMNIGDQVMIKAPNGSMTTNPATVAGNTVTAPFSSSGKGTYVVTWRITSADGHPVSGQFDFTLSQDGSNGSTSGASTSAGAATSSTTASTTAGAPPAGPASTVKGPTTPTTNEPGDNHTGLVVGGAVLGALALAGAFVVARRRMSDDPR